VKGASISTMEQPSRSAANRAVTLSTLSKKLSLLISEQRTSGGTLAPQAITMPAPPHARCELTGCGTGAGHPCNSSVSGGGDPALENDSARVVTGSSCSMGSGPGSIVSLLCCKRAPCKGFLSIGPALRTYGPSKPPVRTNPGSLGVRWTLGRDRGAIRTANAAGGGPAWAVLNVSTKGLKAEPRRPGVASSGATFVEDESRSHDSTDVWAMGRSTVDFQISSLRGGSTAGWDNCGRDVGGGVGCDRQARGCVDGAHNEPRRSYTLLL
jgi:hypothetical protein